MSARVIFTYVVDASSAMSTMQQFASAQKNAEASVGALSSKVIQQTGTVNQQSATIKTATIQTSTWGDAAQQFAGVLQQVGSVGRQAIGVYTALAVWNIRNFQYTQQLIVAKFRLAQIERDLLVVDQKTTTVSLQQAAALQKLYQTQLQSVTGFNDIRVATGQVITDIGRFGASSIEAEDATQKWLQSMQQWADNAVAIGAPTDKVTEVMHVLENSITTGQIPAWDQLAKQIGWNTAAWGPLGTAGMSATQVLAAGSKSVVGSLNNQVTAQQTADNAMKDYNATLQTAQSALKETQMKLDQANAEMYAQGLNIVFAATGITGSIFKIGKSLKDMPWDKIGQKIIGLFGGMSTTVAQTATSTTGSFVQMANSAGASTGQMQVGLNSLGTSLQVTTTTSGEAAAGINIMGDASAVSATEVEGLSVAEDEAAVGAGSMNAGAASMSISETIAAGATSIFAGAVGVLSSAMAFLAANPIILVITALALLAIGLYEAYVHFKPFHDAVNSLAKILTGALYTAFLVVKIAVLFLWNNVFVPFGKFITTVFINTCIKPLIAIWNLLKIPIDIVAKAIGTFWNNVLVPFGNFIGTVLLGSWKLFSAGISILYNTFIKPVFDALSWAYNHILKPVGDFFGGIGKALGGAGKSISNAFGNAGNQIASVNKGLEQVANTEQKQALGSRQTGGMISQTGPYILHAGEEVMAAASVSAATAAQQKMQAILEQISAMIETSIHQMAAVVAGMDSLTTVMASHNVMPTVNPSKTTPAGSTSSGETINYTFSGPITIEVQQIVKPQDIKTMTNQLRRQIQYEKARSAG